MPGIVYPGEKKRLTLHVPWSCGGGILQLPFPIRIVFESWRHGRADLSPGRKNSPVNIWVQTRKKTHLRQPGRGPLSLYSLQAALLSSSQKMILAREFPGIEN